MALIHFDSSLRTADEVMAGTADCNKWLLRCSETKVIVKILDYHKLEDQPFGAIPDPSFLFMSSTHREALASLFYGVNAGRGFVALIAQPGMGKTTLLFKLLQQLETSARTVFIFQTQCSPRDCLRNLLADLDVIYSDEDPVILPLALWQALSWRGGRSKEHVWGEGMQVPPRN